MAPIAIAMLPRKSAKPISRLLRASVEAMLPSSLMIEVAFCSISLASGAASVASILAAGCSSMVWAIASALSCALRNSSSSGLACFQSALFCSAVQWFERLSIREPWRWISFQSVARSALNVSLPVISQPRSEASEA